ncbi:phosphoglycerate kinase [Palleronia sp.]|uniref:phosphoglycerate kinase n=1 Tax=Palleronia sp. TaxID=1940284 RepID=UPI0035C7BC15
MNLPNIDDMDVKGKRVLVRADLNVPMKDGEIADDSRLSAAMPTLRNIIDRGGRLIVIAHLDRPGGKRDMSASLRPVADAIREGLNGTSVAFAEDCVGPEAEDAVRDLAEGQCLVLENLRFHAGEKENDSGFAQALAKLADIYVNDAFSASHREHASITGLPTLLSSAAGLLMQKELETLERLLAEPRHPYVALLGGAKAETKVPVVEHLLDRADSILLGGVMATTFLQARGAEVGRSKVDDAQVEAAKQLLERTGGAGAKLMLPVDVIVASEMSAEAEGRVVAADRVGPEDMILDIGVETIRRYADAMSDARTVVWNGPMGAAEFAPFQRGTHFLAAGIAERTQTDDLVSVVGGGDTVAFLRRHQFLHVVSYASMAGGAFLKWLAGEDLPGVEALLKAG